MPVERLRGRTVEVATKLAGMNTHVLRAAKVGFKKVQQMSWDAAEDYLYAKLDDDGPTVGRGRARSRHPR